MTAWKTLMSDPELIQNLGEDSFEESDYKKIEKFFCILYGMPNEDSIDRVRFQLFLKKRNPEALPPTSDALYLHIKRVHFQSIIWRKAIFPRPSLPDATDFGYEMTDTGLKPLLMTKDGIPSSALKFTYCNCSLNCKDNRCGCRKANLSCTLYCGCVESSNNFISCMNAPETFNDEEEY